jgi:diguanylate cyclase (GGDEF)-like protein
LVLFCVTIIINIWLGYYFYVSKENIFKPGTFYLVLELVSYFPILIIMIDISLAPKHIKRTQVILTIFFVITTAVGAAVDIILRTTNLIWPCATASILYVYFFIIRSESKIDSLTGIGNRSSFNEYIYKLSRQTARRDYAFVMLDIDRFSEINDKLGYLEGDNALRDIAAIIKGYVRYTDFAARFGGDEFILVTTAENDSQNIIDRINKALDTQNKLFTRPYQLYISYGYGIYTTNSSLSIQDFLTQIDKKMYQYKESRRERLPSAISENLKEKTTSNGETSV